jgi:hypothetical protein
MSDWRTSKQIWRVTSLWRVNIRWSRLLFRQEGYSMKRNLDEAKLLYLTHRDQ